MRIVEDVMRDAYEAAQRSPDPSTQTGAIIVSSNGSLVGVGHNHFPRGVPEELWHDREAKYARVVHAEVAAILDAARRGISTVGSTMVAPWAACTNCAKHIADAGVQILIRHRFLDNGVTEESPWYEDCLVGDEIMRGAGITITEIPPVEWHSQLRRNGALWP